MGGSGGERVTDGESSGEEDGDEQWRAAINSVAGVPSVGAVSGPDDYSGDDISERAPQKLTYFQIKLQKALSDMLEKTVEMVRNPIKSMDEEDPLSCEGGVQLFKCAPRGIVFDHVEKLQGPKRKPRIAPGEDVDENSKQFRKRLKSVVIDGNEISAAAEDVRRKSLARLRAKEEAATEAVKKEEQRVAELKKIRGERWLPSMAKEMQWQLKTTHRKH